MQKKLFYALNLSPGLKFAQMPRIFPTVFPVADLCEKQYSRQADNH
jgi:hypothetical protein